MKNITFCVLMFYGIMAHAQLVINNTARTPAQLVTDVLVDPSVSPYNIKFNGTAVNAGVINSRAGQFSTNFNPINLGFAPFTTGVILGTGNATLAYGPNNAGGLSNPSAPNYAGDADLAAQTTNTVINSAVLEFDFVATGLEMTFDYVFASEEYPEYANSGFNDVFGFFLTGPNSDTTLPPYNAMNIAVVPSTTIPITINNVNNGTGNGGPCEFCQYYVNNGTGSTPAANPHVQYDGFTTVLTARAKLRCGEVYHMKIAIANVGDNAFDSAVFLRDFKIKPIVLTANNSQVPICPGVPISIESGVVDDDYVYQWYCDGVLLYGANNENLTAPTTAPVPAAYLQAGRNYTINSVGAIPTDFTLLGAPDNNLGTAFTATGPGAGDGTAIDTAVDPYAPVNAPDLIPGSRYQINVAGNTDFTLLGAANNNTGTLFVATAAGMGTGNAMYAPEYTFEYYTAAPTPPNPPNTPACLLGRATYSLTYYTDPFLDPVDITLCTNSASPYVFGNINQTTAMLNGGSPIDYDIRYYNNLAQAEAPVPTPGISAADLANFTTPNSSETIYVRFEDLTTSGCIYVKSFKLTAELAPSGTFSYPDSPYCAQLPLQPITTTVSTGGTYSATPAGLALDPVTGEINPSASTPGNYLVDYLLPATATCPQFQVDDIPVSITATPAAPSVVTPLTYCQGESALVLTAGGTNLKWYNTATGGTGSAAAPTPDTSSSGSVTYYVSQTNGCEGPRASIVVNITAAPAAPTFTAVAPYCQNATAVALTATGTSLKWYTAATGGVGSATAPVPPTTTPGIVNYYVTQTVSGCESPRAAIAVETIALPSAPTVVSPIAYCQNEAPAVLTATGANLLWYAAATGGVGNAAPPTVSTTGAGSTTFYVSQTVSGCEGPRAAITVDVNPIPNAPTFAITQPTCAVNTATITIGTPLGANLEYSINNGVNYQSNTTFAGVTAGVTYDVKVRNSLTGCVSAVTQAVINPALIIPAAPTASATFQPNCTTPTGTIEVTAPVGANLEYTINGGTSFQAGTTFAGLAPNAAYTIYVRDTATGCVSTTSVVNVNPIPANPVAPTLTVTQPICTTPTGTVTISAPTGVNLEYSIDGGTNYQSSTIFAGLTPNANYNLTVRDNVTGCISAITVAVVNPIPANPAIPVATAVQPTCGVNTGSFTINSPVGANLQYSNDGGITYQNGVTFSALAAGTTYNPIVKDIVTGCVSAPGSVVINPALNVPVAPTMSVTVQPLCTSPTGTIVVSAPTGANLAYSINGGTSFQVNTTFAGLAPNATYSVIVKDNVSGCVSTASTAVVNPLPAAPAAPTASATFQPICTTPTGTIIITAPTGADFEYSINGGTTYQSGTTFASLAPNATYNLTVRNILTGCVSAATAVIIDPIPANPTAPTGTMTQPTCIAPTGAISITNPLGANLEYSIDGGTTYQTGTDFTALVANTTYNILVRNTTTGCVSAPGAFTILPAPTFPATPVASGSNVCAEGTIALSTPAVAGATYSWTGPNGFASSDQNPNIANATPAMAGTYSVVIMTTANCPSLPGSVTIAVDPLPLPSLPQDGYICFNAVTNAVLNPYTLQSGLSNTDYDFAWYVESGGTYNLISGQDQSSYVVIAPGNYGVVATNLATGCVSHMVTAPVGMTSPPLAMEVVSSEYFADNQSIAINVSPPGNYEYQLDNGAFQSSNVFNNVSSGTHVVKVRNECDQIEKEAYLMDYPKFFTPNGDGYNDTWNIFALKGQANAKIYIFDRYGKLLKEISPSGKGWDGTFNQNILPSTDYWFSVHYKENDVEKVFKSHFALKR